jgi:hypothetical protein
LSPASSAVISRFSKQKSAVRIFAVRPETSSDFYNRALSVVMIFGTREEKSIFGLDDLLGRSSKITPGSGIYSRNDAPEVALSGE